MVKLLDTKHNWLLKVFYKTYYLFVKRHIHWYWILQYLIILVAQQGLHLYLMMMLQPICMAILLRMILI